MSLRRGRRKNCNTTTDSESAISLRELLKTNKTSHEKTTIVNYLIFFMIFLTLMYIIYTLLREFYRLN